MKADGKGWMLERHCSDSFPRLLQTSTQEHLFLTLYCRSGRHRDSIALVWI